MHVGLENKAEVAMTRPRDNNWRSLSESESAKVRRNWERDSRDSPKRMVPASCQNLEALVFKATSESCFRHMRTAPPNEVTLPGGPDHASPSLSKPTVLQNRVIGHTEFDPISDVAM